MILIEFESKHDLLGHLGVVGVRGPEPGEERDRAKGEKVDGLHGHSWCIGRMSCDRHAELFDLSRPAATFRMVDRSRVARLLALHWGDTL
jgi:hypothetical protein